LNKTVFRTEQEAFWAGAFGDEYSRRNVGDSIVASNTALFTRILRSMPRPASVLELGSNVGLNLRALRALLPDADIAAVEINESAAKQAATVPNVRVHTESILDFSPDRPYDLTFTKGVLIHIDPDHLPAVYETLYRASAGHVLVAEYYNPSPVEVPYRGHSERLFKRDFAGDLMERYPDLRLVDYGFVYKRDRVFPQDDVTWFLLRKEGGARQELP
jgi:spore coat polysaccharide biosynthesis protein SpsF